MLTISDLKLKVNMYMYDKYYKTNVFATLFSAIFGHFIVCQHPVFANVLIKGILRNIAKVVSSFYGI